MKARTDPSIITKIKDLRSRGYSIPEISIQCRVSKSTSSRYAKNVKILPQYYQRWLDRRNAGKIISERNWAIAQEKAKNLINDVSSRDLAIVASVLYWAEGSKRDFSFTNSDPKMIVVFVKILKSFFGVSNEDLKVSIRIYNDLNRQACLRFWSKVVEKKLLENNTSINVLQGKKDGKLQYGMCRIRVKKGGNLLKHMFSINSRIHDLLQS